MPVPARVQVVGALVVMEVFTGAVLLTNSAWLQVRLRLVCASARCLCACSSRSCSACARSPRVRRMLQGAPPTQASHPNKQCTPRPSVMQCTHKPCLDC